MSGWNKTGSFICCELSYYPWCFCALIYLEVISDEALFEGGRVRVLDGEVPATEDLIGHIHTVTLPEHPGMLVAHDRPVREA